MKKFAFVSRHTPTPEQKQLAEFVGIQLIPVGDRDAFTLDPVEFSFYSEWEGVIVVNPAAALRLIACAKCVGVFENSARLDGGFNAKALHLFYGTTTGRRDCDDDCQACCEVQHNVEGVASHSQAWIGPSGEHDFTYKTRDFKNLAIDKEITAQLKEAGIPTN